MHMMAIRCTGGGGFFSWPSTRRRQHTNRKLSSIQTSSKLSVSASSPQLHAQSLPHNDVVSSRSDYVDQCRQLINTSDGGPPRWFSPLECASQSKDSPLLLYLPGVDGVGLGLVLHHERLSKMFNIWCMHIPFKDRTSFTELVEFVESVVRIEHSRAPNRPIYLVGESFGGCLALAVAARNPDIDLMLILANPATSFRKSLVQPAETLLTLSTFIPQHISSRFPFLLTLLLGPAVNMVTSAMGKRLPSIEQDVCNAFFTAETLGWKLEMLKSAATFANSQLDAVKSQTLILASAQDKIVASKEEAERLRKVLPNCKVRLVEDKGHSLLLEEGVSILSIIIIASFYRRGLHHDYVKDYFPPTLSEFQGVYNQHSWIDGAMSPVMLSTVEDGSIVRSLGGIPCEGPVVYVGYHMLHGVEVVPLISRFWTEKNILLRALAIPIYFSVLRQGKELSETRYDFLSIMGAVPVTPANFHTLFSANSHVLLYPGGAREAAHKKGEEYKLFWPEQAEFVRMAAKFGAKIVPFGVVGEDDFCHLLLDYDDQKNLPYFKNAIEELKIQAGDFRKNAIGEVANLNLCNPVIVPKVPGRFYYLFGKPIETQGRKVELMRNREKAHELYLEVKNEVEKCLSYLKEKRKSDPFRSIFARLSYQATHGFDSEVPTFDFTTKDL